MRFSQTEAQHCVDLLSLLDEFVMQNSPVRGKFLNKMRRMGVDTLNDEHLVMFRAMAREIWQENDALVECCIRRASDLSDADKETMRSWKGSFKEAYIALKKIDDYLLLHSFKGSFFAVHPLTSDFDDLLRDGLPAVIRTSLVMYKGCIVWDGLIEVGPVEFDDEHNTMSGKLAALAVAEGLVQFEL